MEPREVSVGILAGGMSRRMGTDKAMLTIDGETFLERIISRCADFSEVIVSTARSRPYNHLPVRKVFDEAEGFGPVEGLRRLLGACASDHLIAVAADMPFVTSELLRALAAAHDPDRDCLMTTRGGRLEPLCSVYSKRALAAFDAMAASGERRVRAVLDRVDAAFVEIEDLGVDASALRNINTPEDLRGDL